MILEGKICTLREWKKEDTNDLIHMANNKKIFDNLRDIFPYPYTKKDAENWINFVTNHNQPVLNFAISYQGQFAGSFGILFKDDIYRLNAEIGYWLGENFWNKGIISEAIVLGTNYIFKNFDIIRVYAEPFADNIGSRKALEKAGFKLDVTFKNYIFKNNRIKDSCIYSMQKEDMNKFKDDL
jgi:ribosomal-protein-alanine N-acetyltransferase